MLSSIFITETSLWQLWEHYDQRFGHRVRAVLQLKRSVSWSHGVGKNISETVSDWKLCKCWVEQKNKLETPTLEIWDGQIDRIFWSLYWHSLMTWKKVQEKSSSCSWDGPLLNIPHICPFFFHSLFHVLLKKGPCDHTTNIYSGNAGRTICCGFDVQQWSSWHVQPPNKCPLRVTRVVTTQFFAEEKRKRTFVKVEEVVADIPDMLWACVVALSLVVKTIPFQPWPMAGLFSWFIPKKTCHSSKSRTEDGCCHAIPTGVSSEIRNHWDDLVFWRARCQTGSKLEFNRRPNLQTSKSTH